MAARYCGRSGFESGVRDYIQKFAFQNATTNDLLECLSAATGKDMVGFVGQVLVKNTKENHKTTHRFFFFR